MARLAGVDATLRTYGGLIVNRLIDGLQQSEQIASGDLEESITFEVDEVDGAVRLDVLLADYYKFVDMGRAAGKMPPISKLREWLRYPNVKDRLGINGLPDMKLNGIAYLMARKIKREGTKGNHFFTNVVDKSGIIDELSEAVADAAMNDLSLSIDQLIKTVETRTR